MAKEKPRDEDEKRSPEAAPSDEAAQDSSAPDANASTDAPEAAPNETNTSETKAKKRKTYPLRISHELYTELQAWADQEMRSVNSQIEFLLRDAVRKHRKS